MKVDPKQLSMEQLKAHAYDQIQIIEHAKRNLQALNVEIERKLQEEAKHGNSTDGQLE